MKCKKLDWYLKINEINSRYWFIKENSNDTLNEQKKFLFIKDSDIFNFYDYTYEWDKEEMIQLQHISSIDKTKLIDDWQFIISTKYLHDVYIGQSLVSMIIKNEKPINLIEEISWASEFMWSVKTTEFINNIDQYISVH